jgi:hypothetical protein
VRLRRPRGGRCRPGYGARGGDHAVKFDEFARDPVHLPGQGVEFLGEPTKNSTVSMVRFGHGGHDAGLRNGMDE